MNLIFKYIKPYKLWIIITLLIKIIGTLCDLVIPYVLSYIIDVVILKGSISRIVIYGVIMILCSLCGFLFNVFANKEASIICKKSTSRIRYDLFEAIEGLSETKKDKITLPSLVGRMTTDTYNINQMTGMMLRLGVRAPILLIGGIIVCFFVDEILTLVMLVILPIILLVIVIISHHGLPIFKSLQDENDKLVQNVRENVTGARVIKALNKEEEEKQRFEQINTNVSKVNTRANSVMAGLNPIITILLNVGLVGVIIFGAYRCNKGLCSKGDIVAFTSYFAIISNSMLTFTRLFITASKASASAKRINEVFALESEIIKEQRDDTSNEFIEFRDVSFSYLKKHNNISNITFSIKKGESLGIIGATGSGKSTILNLLLRFYNPDKGEIYYDGKNIKSYEPNEYRKKFGTVFQADLIFNDTIYENVSFGRDLTDNEVIEALKKAQAYDFVNNLEDGIMTVLRPKGNNLSGGQKQRILIARALAGQSEVIVLDDSSSALDYKTDLKLRTELYQNYSNIILIAQRISSIKDCDKIIVLDKGNIVGYGTHSELLKSCDIYSYIAYSQMGGSE
ncbi:MAG: ABC transporter ATP-binding protein [Anaeroplasmataceae bacterium]